MNTAFETELLIHGSRFLIKISEKALFIFSMLAVTCFVVGVNCAETCFMARYPAVAVMLDVTSHPLTDPSKPMLRQPHN